MGRVGVLDQRERGQVGRLLQWRAALEQPGARHRRQLLAEQAHRMRRHRRRRPMAQRQVDVGDVQVEHGIGGVDADVDVGVVALELLQPRNQPHRGERRERGQCHRAAARALADLAHRAVDARQGLRHRQQQLRAGAGQFHRPRVPQEQAHAHFPFQRLDLAAHRRLGQRQFLRGGAEVQVPRDGFEGAQVADRDRAGAQARLGVLQGGGPGSGDWFIDAISGINSLAAFHWISKWACGDHLMPKSPHWRTPWL